MEVLPVKYTGKLKETIFRQDYYREQMKAYLDNLNLLYVAFTRAEESLFACTPLPSLDKKTGMAKAGEVNGLLYRLLSGQVTEGTKTPGAALDLRAHWDSESNIFSLGTPEEIKQKKEVSQVEQVELKHYFTQRWRKRMAVKKRTGSLAYTKTGENPSAHNWSQTIHAVLAKTASKQDLTSALDQVYFEGLVNREEQKVVKGKIEQIISHPIAGDWFTEDWKIRTELSILAGGGYISKPDRVLTRGKTAIAIDFKAGEALPEHEKRIRQYKSLLKRMNYQQIKGYLYYLDENRVEEVD